MGQIDVVDRSVQRINAGGGALAAKSESKQSENRRLVESRKTLHSVAITRRHQYGVVSKPSSTVSGRPATEIVERLGKIPVIEAEPWFDAGGENCIDKPVVEYQARLIRVAPPQRKNTRPSDGETIGMDAEPLHQPNVLQVTVVVIASDLAFLAIGVPNAKAAPVFARRPLDLKARG